MTGIDVRYTTRAGETFDGYLTGPGVGAKAPGILLITAIFGVDQEMRELADAWAGDGFLVSVPDIFWRQVPGPTADMAVAFDRYGKFDPVQGMRDIEDLVHDLKARPECNGKVAILGFCFGGRYALLGAARLGIAAAASFHGTLMGQHLHEVDRVTCPVSFHFGDSDPVVPMEEVDAIREAFAARTNADIGVYRGAGHNFSMPRKEGYHPAAARESRDRVLRCFRSM
jgi:carboxymethylenebutenolidase